MVLGVDVVLLPSFVNRADRWIGVTFGTAWRRRRRVVESSSSVLNEHVNCHFAACTYHFDFSGSSSPVRQ